MTLELGYLQVNKILSKERKVSVLLINATIITSIIYLLWWFLPWNAGNLWLYIPLAIGEIYHVWQIIGYALTVKDQKVARSPKIKSYPSVDIFITVCGEPVDIVRNTINAVKEIKYPNFKIYVLNDGLVAKKDNWLDIVDLANEMGVNVFTRKKPGGAKAGNVNHALRRTNSDLFVVFDADYIPHPEFLQKTVGFFEDKKMALVQTPQYYINKTDSFITDASWEQQELFFGPICRGKSNLNSMFWCGTNAVLRRSAIVEVGLIPEDNIAEDFIVSLSLHKNGWKSKYLPQVLAYGLAPLDLKNYVTQQYRWARGSLEIIFKHNPLFIRNLSWKQKVQYLHSSSFYLSGIIVLIDAMIPLVVLTTGIVPVSASSASFALFFGPFMLLTIFLLIESTNGKITFKSIQLSMSSFIIFIRALLSVIFRVKSKFVVTSKSTEQGNYLMFASFHILYVLISVVVVIWAYLRDGINPSLVNNASWLIFNITMFFGFIIPAYPWHTIPIKLTNFVYSILGGILPQKYKPVYVPVEVNNSERNDEDI